MEKVENNPKYSELFNELKSLNSEYNRILAELAVRGIKDVKSSAKQWSDEKIEALEKRAEQIAGKIKGAGEVALGLGILGAEAGIRGTKLAIKGAKTLYSSTKNKVDRLQLRATMYQVGLKKEARKAVRDAKQFAKDKKQDAKDWVDDRVEDVKSAGKTVIKGAKTFHTQFKNKVDRTVLKATMYQVGLKRDARKAARDAKQFAKDKKLEVKKFVNDKKEDAGRWVNEKINDAKDFADSAKIVGGFVKEGITSKKNDIIKDSKVKAEEFIDTAKQAKDRFEQRKNKTLLGAVRGVKSIATALEGKLEERILTDKEKVEKTQPKQPQKKQTKEMGMEME